MLINNASQHHQKAISAILKPLQQTLGITYFSYCSYNKNQGQLIHCNYQAAIEFIHDPESILPIDLQTHCSIIKWEEYCSSYYLSYLKDQYPESLTGITLKLNHSDTEAEHICIGVTKNHNKILNSLISQKKIRNQVVNSIRTGVLQNKDKLISVNFRKQTVHKKQQQANTKQLITLDDKQFIYGLKGATFITLTEKKCLKLLLKLLTIPEIAHSLKLSKTEVSIRIDSLKNKLGVVDKHDFFLIARNNLLLPYQEDLP